MAHPPIIGLGTAAIGRPQYINIRSSPGASSFSLPEFRQAGRALLEEAYRKGVRYFDTAPGYGIAEELLIDWLKEAERPGLEVATKWGYTYVANFNPQAKVHEVKEHSLAKLNEQWTQSRKLLPYLKTYQIHSATFASGVLENEAVLHRLAEIKRTHNVRIGLTTSGPKQIALIKRALEVVVDGKHLFEVFQVTYNLFEQSLATLSDTLGKSDRRWVIKEAMANGRVFPNKAYPHYEAAYQELLRLANKYGVGIDAITLRYCLDSIPVFSVLSGAAKSEHLQANLNVGDFVLTAAEVAGLSKFNTTPEAYWSERSELDWS